MYSEKSIDSIHSEYFWDYIARAPVEISYKECIQTGGEAGSAEQCFLQLITHFQGTVFSRSTPLLFTQHSQPTTMG